MNQVAALTKGMLDRVLWVAHSRLVGSREDFGEHLQGHLEYMISLEETGVLFASGPFFENGASNGNGMTIVRATSRDEAKEILDRDPLVAAGVRTYELHEWHMMEGMLHLTVLASRQRGVVP